MTAPTILATRRLPGQAFNLLDNLEILHGQLPESLGDSPRKGIRTLIVNDQRVDGRVLDLLPDIGLVANVGVGYDLVDVSECDRRGVSVIHTPGVVDRATADLAFALLLAVRRRVVEADGFIRTGAWPSSRHDSMIGHDVSGSTLGIVGLGRIGKAVARRAAAFDMHVLYNATRRQPPEVERQLAVEYRELDQLLREVDAVTIHCPLGPQTIGLIDGRRLSLLRDDSCIINTARGRVIDEVALLQELRAGRLHAGLDVYANEPHVAVELLDLPNVVLTPHVGTSTHETRAAMTALVVRNILAFQAGQPLLTPVREGSSRHAG
jgi:glyoxylate reductase